MNSVDEARLLSLDKKDSRVFADSKAVTFGCRSRPILHSAIVRIHATAERTKRAPASGEKL